jgi:hypothetical protein
VPPRFFCRTRLTHHKSFVANNIPHPGPLTPMSLSKKLLTLITSPCYSAASLLTKPASNLPPGSHHLRMVRGVYAASDREQV